MHNPFSEKMASLSDEKLLAVLDRSSGYQPEAVEAARREWEKRGLTAADAERLRGASGTGKKPAAESVLHAAGQVLDRFLGSIRRGLVVKSRQEPEAAVHTLTVYLFALTLADLAWNWRWIRYGWRNAEFFMLLNGLLGPALLLLLGVLLIEKQRLAWRIGPSLLGAIAGGVVAYGLLTEPLDIDIYHLVMCYNYVSDRTMAYHLAELAGIAFLLWLFFRQPVRRFFGGESMGKPAVIVIAAFAGAVLLCTAFLYLAQPERAGARDMLVVPVEDVRSR